MLSPKGLNKKVSKFDRPELSEPITVRVVFTKLGDLQFFSHLDLQRTWQRVLVRASMPMWYTKGFNPHSKIVFGVPLPVGSESLCEMVDLRIDRLISCDEIRDQLNAELTDEMQVMRVYVPNSKYTEVAYAEYEITLHTGDLADSLCEKINEMFSTDAEPIIMSKRSKSGEKEINILDLVKDVSASALGEEARISTTIAAGSQENLNPEYLVTAMRQKLGILAEDASPDKEWYRILRIRFLRADGSEFM